MFPFDSPLSIISIVVVAAMLVFYTFLVVKLKPSKEHVEMTLNDFNERKKTGNPVTSIEISKSTHKEAISAIQKENTEANQSRPVMSTISIEQDEKKNGKGKESKKSFILFGKTEFEGCPHNFGYLKSLRKNAPIPDECFGCPQILECLVIQKSK